MKVIKRTVNPLVAEVGEVLTEKTRSDSRPSRDYFSIALTDAVDVLGKPARILVMQGHYFTQGVEKTRWEGGNPNIIKNLVGKPLTGHTVYQVETPNYTIQDPRTGQEKIVNKRTFVVRPGQTIEQVYDAWKKTLPAEEGGENVVEPVTQPGLQGPTEEETPEI